MESQAVGIILAGGESSRMGEAKALLPFQDGTLLDYMLDLLKEAGCAEVRISGEVAGYQGVADLTEHLGATGGIATILQKYPEQELFLFVPVDMPALSVSSLQQLFTPLADYDARCWGDAPFPLLIKNTASIRQTITQQIEQQKLAVKNLLDQLNVERLPNAEHANELQNINTPEQWEAFKAQQS